MDDLISRKQAIDALWGEREKLEAFMNECLERGLFAFRSGTKAERNRIEEDIEIITHLPSAQPERKRMSNKEWIDFLSEQFDVSRTSAREMLHGLMKWKAEDNFKKQFRR